MIVQFSVFCPTIFVLLGVWAVSNTSQPPPFATHNHTSDYTRAHTHYIHRPMYRTNKTVWPTFSNSWSKSLQTNDLILDKHFRHNTFRCLQSSSWLSWDCLWSYSSTKGKIFLCAYSENIPDYRYNFYSDMGTTLDSNNRTDSILALENCAIVALSTVLIFGV